MRILEVSRYKNNFADHQVPFVTEQGEAIRALGHEVEYFLVRGNYVKAVGALKKKIREFKPDIVHAHYGLSAITAELQSLVPVVTTFHDGETHKWYVNLMCSLMSLRAKHVIYVAQHIRDLSYFKARNYSIIPCGVTLKDCFLMDKAEARKELGWDADTKYIVFGGAFNDLRKNYPFLKRAVERLKSEGINELGKIEIIEMRGLSREECVLRMNACDVFALPSHREGSPQALKEAMAVNCPCIATDIADVRVLFGDENCGAIIETSGREPGHWILRNPTGKLWDWQEDEKSLDEMVALLKEALQFKGRTKGRKRLEELGYTNEQAAVRIVKIYESIIKH